MGLRAKVALILAAAIIPISIGFSAWRIASEHREMTERRIDRVASRMQRLDTGSCADLERMRDQLDRRRGRRARPSRTQFRPWMYSHQLDPHADAPAFPNRLRRVVDSEDPVHAWSMPGQPTLGYTAVRLAPAGDCAVAVIPWSREDVPPVALRTAAMQTVGLAAVLALLGMLVAMPVVRRIRRLEEAVLRARFDEFTLDLGGDDEINSLAAAFAQTLDAVRERERALEEYIGNTTHDLAIPVTVLQHRLRKLADESDSEDVRVALEESHYIANLIANMRTAAKLESLDAPELDHQVDLSEIVERVVQRHAPIASQKGVDLNFATPVEPLRVRGEPTLIEQALSNLVQNAVQYNATGGHVSVVLEDVADGFEIVVADDGPGIPQTMREAVMARGVRDDAARTRHEGGQGFGLAIVRRVVSLHSWTMELEHETGLVVRLRGARIQ